MENWLYSKKHIWIEKIGNEAKIGISDYAQEQLGSIMFINLPDVNYKLEVGAVFGDVESIKTVHDLISPLKGEVLEINESVIDDPSLINESPYKGWLIRVAVDEVDSTVMTYEKYIEYKESL